MRTRDIDRNRFSTLLGQLYTRATLTQEELARRVGVSSAAVRNWLRGDEGGHGITVEKLRKVIEILFQADAFVKGEEETEARELWQSSGVKAAFDERWFRGLQQAAEAEQSALGPRNGQRAQAERTRDEHQTPRSVFFFNVHTLPDPTEFYGRVKECFILEERTYNSASTSIVGPNKIGKTWLMHYLRLTASQKLGRQFRVGYVDALSPSCMTVEGFIALAAKQFGVPLAAEYAEQGLTPLEQIVANLLDEKQIPVLCIDRFETFATRPAFDQHFFGGLRALAQAGLCLITTSKRRLVDIVTEATHVSSLINIFDQIVLEPFNEKEAKDFVKKKGMQAGFSEQECSYMLHYGQLEDRSWAPLRLQLAGQMLFEDKNVGDYHPDDPHYWRCFAERLEERYRGVLR